MEVTIIEKDFITPTECFNDWYYTNLIGGITSPYAAYTSAADRYRKQALMNFCMACCSQKFKSNFTVCTCKKACEKARMFQYLTYTK